MTTVEIPASAARPRLRVLYLEPDPEGGDRTRRHLCGQAPHIDLRVVAEPPPAQGDSGDAFDVLLLHPRRAGEDALRELDLLRARLGRELPAVVLVEQEDAQEVERIRLHPGGVDCLAAHAGYLRDLPAALQRAYDQAEVARDRLKLRQTSQRLEHVLAISPTILYTLALDGEAVAATWVSGNIERLMGFTPEQALAPGWWLDRVHPEDRQRALQGHSMLRDAGAVEQVYRVFDGAGRLRWIRDELRVAGAEGDGARTAIGAWQDITGQKLDELMQQVRIEVLDGLNLGRDLGDILLLIVKRLEHAYPDMLVSILLRDASDGRLYTGCAPSLPQDYNAAVDGLEPAVGHGSCGSSAALGTRVIVEDIEHHPYWEPYAHIARAAGLAACWSTPFKDQHGQILGTFGIYYRRPRSPEDS